MAGPHPPPPALHPPPPPKKNLNIYATKVRKKTPQMCGLVHYIALFSCCSSSRAGVNILLHCYFNLQILVPNTESIHIICDIKVTTNLRKHLRSQCGKIQIGCDFNLGKRCRGVALSEHAKTRIRWIKINSFGKFRFV